jgi:hypothetical protein
MLGGRWLVALLLVGAVAGSAAASPTSAAAEAAFDKGRELMTQGLFSEACAAFDQSERLDPQIGTLYNLAGCWEKVGKLASAWTAYREVAQRDTNGTRRKAADEHARALTPRLPRLVIKLSSPPPGVVVQLNGGDVTKLIGIETPMDLGTYPVLVSAKGYQPWGAEAKVLEEGKLVTITVPALVAGDTTAPPPDQPPVVTTHARIPPPSGEPQVADHDDGGNRHGTLAVVTATTGGAALIGGLVVGVLARGKLSDAEQLCKTSPCASQEDADASNALCAASRTRGNLSTGLVVVGAGALVASGILWWTGRGDDHPPTTAIAPVASPSWTGLVVTGSF